MSSGHPQVKKKKGPRHRPYIVKKNLLRKDHKPKWKHRTIKCRRKSGWLCVWQWLFRKTPKGWSSKRVSDKLDLKLKTLALQKTLQREWEDKLHSGKKYLQSTYMIRNVI